MNREDRKEFQAEDIKRAETTEAPASSISLRNAGVAQVLSGLSPPSTVPQGPWL